MSPWHAAAIWPEVERVARNYGVQTLVSHLAEEDERSYRPKRSDPQLGAPGIATYYEQGRY